MELDYQISGCGRQFISSSVSTCKDVEADAQTHGFSGIVCSQRQHQDVSLIMAVEDSLVLFGRQPGTASPFFRIMPAMHQMGTSRGEMEL